jgi:single-stranded DNA-specific DHH superfamily exonuclease
MIDYEKLRKEFDDSVRPMYFFHDDTDGLASFLLVYKYIKEGIGVPVKTQPTIDLKFLPKVKDYDPDKVFILDIANVNQDFLDEVHIPVVWVDHHEPQERTKVKIFNPRVKHPSAYIPATYLCYGAIKQNDWIMIVGCLGDQYLPPEAQEFAEKYPDLLTPKQAKDVESARYDSKIAVLVKLFNFIVKGKLEDVKKCIRVMCRINDPYELLNQSTPEGKFIWQRYEKINDKYMKLWNSVAHMKPKDKILAYTYSMSEFSFTGNLADDLMHKFKHDLIIVGREASDEVRGSMRYDKGGLPKIIAKALAGIQGYGGGHDNACGFTVKKVDFNQFIENLKAQL